MAGVRGGGVGVGGYVESFVHFVKLPHLRIFQNVHSSGTLLDERHNFGHERVL